MLSSNRLQSRSEEPHLQPGSNSRSRVTKSLPFGKESTPALTSRVKLRAPRMWACALATPQAPPMAGSECHVLAMVAHVQPVCHASDPILGTAAALTFPALRKPSRRVQPDPTFQPRRALEADGRKHRLPPTPQGCSRTRARGPRPPPSRVTGWNPRREERPWPVRNPGHKHGAGYEKLSGAVL